jgi:hypothetical protein
MIDGLDGDLTVCTNIDAYSDLNIGFHQVIIALSNSQWLATTTGSVFVHWCSTQARTIGANDRMQPIGPTACRVSTRWGWLRMWKRM